jgi:hypothetical protein
VFRWRVLDSHPPTPPSSARRGRFFATCASCSPRVCRSSRDRPSNGPAERCRSTR